MVPVHTGTSTRSPFFAARDGAGALLERDGVPVARITFPPQPAFYGLATADGIPYWKIATLHGRDVLATTVVQDCIRYRNRKTQCQFCAIGESLKADRTIARKTPQQLGEVAAAAVRLDGVKHVVLTTGTPNVTDRGAAVLCESATGIRAAVDLPIQAQCEPPDDFAWFERLRTAGVAALGMHLEAVEPAVRARAMPGKAKVPIAYYLDAFAASVRVFGRGQVSTYIIAGLGDAPESILAMCARLVALGVYPFVVPLVPIGGTPLAEASAPEPHVMRALLEELGTMLRDANLTSADIKAGCGKCGACSSLSALKAPDAKPLRRRRDRRRPRRSLDELSAQRTRHRTRRARKKSRRARVALRSLGFLLSRYAELAVPAPEFSVCRRRPARIHEERRDRSVHRSVRGVVRPPLREGVTVAKLARSENGHGYDVRTTRGDVHADHVVVAVGGYHTAELPRIAERMSRDIVQLHSSAYKSPQALPEGDVLVVGTGQSGAQIAEDLHLAGRRVHLCVGSAPRTARRYRGKDVVAWLDEIGYYSMPVHEHPLKERVRGKPNHYVTGRDGGHDIDLRKFASEGMRLYGRLLDVRDGTLVFGDDLKTNLDGADAVAESIKTTIDRFIEQHGIDAPAEARYAPLWEPEHHTRELDHVTAGIGSAVWCMGYRSDYRWIDIPIFDGTGYPSHQRGVTAAAGLYFLGLPWQFTWGSGRLSGVARDAEHLVACITARHDTAGHANSKVLNELALGS